MRAAFSAAAAISAILFLSATVRADEASDKARSDQFHALAQSQAGADLAVRNARTFFDQNESTWRQSSQATEAGRGKLDEAYAKAIDTEQRKPDDLRNPQVIDGLNALRSAAEQEWQKYLNVTHPSLDSAFHDAATSTAAMNELFQNLGNIERGLKDASVDLSPLATLYDELAKKAVDAHDKGTKALADQQEAEKAWEAKAQAGAQQPAAGPPPATPGPATAK